jgi:hypothetical protein
MRLTITTEAVVVKSDFLRPISSEINMLFTTTDLQSHSKFPQKIVVTDIQRKEHDPSMLHY